MENYMINNGDIIRVFEKFAKYGQIYFVTEITSDGRYIAHPMNGPALNSHPLDTIEYIRINGTWWEVVATHCDTDTLRKYNNVTYDLEEIKPCAACVLESQYKELQV